MSPAKLFLWLLPFHLHHSKQSAAKSSTGSFLQLAFPVLGGKKLLPAFELAFLTALPGGKVDLQVSSSP